MFSGDIEMKEISSMKGVNEFIKFFKKFQTDLVVEKYFLKS